MFRAIDRVGISAIEGSFAGGYVPRLRKFRTDEPAAVRGPIRTLEGLIAIKGTFVRTLDPFSIPSTATLSSPSIISSILVLSARERLGRCARP